MGVLPGTPRLGTPVRAPPFPLRARAWPSVPRDSARAALLLRLPPAVVLSDPAVMPVAARVTRDSGFPALTHVSARAAKGTRAPFDGGDDE
ncbi:hypothetical protein [Streptomyces sp. HNM0575]|uniref:hypothetical protein n=1 Tax=Streptomyces sp. HNM0575 TaxID=2716338 RepID=UPI00145F76D3|nr:hypothetical protein [Streptomyces sp. HNM0575]